MKRHYLLPTIVLAGALVLAGCQKKAVDVKNESVSGVVQKVTDAGLRFRPGRWETAVKFVSMDMPGMPPQAQAAMGQVMGKGHAIASCLTKEQAEKPDSRFFGQADNHCRYDHFTMGGGTIDAALVCKGGEMDRTMKMHGSYTPETYDMTVESSGAGPNGKPMTMTMAMVSKRVGDCTGSEDDGGNNGRPQM